MLNFMFLGTNGSMQGDEGNTSLLFKGSRGTVLVDAVSYTHLDVYKRQDYLFTVIRMENKTIGTVRVTAQEKQEEDAE